MEASTPFVSLRGVLSKIGLKTSNLYIVNGLVMLMIFFLCRIAMFPYVVYLYADSVNLDYLTVSFNNPSFKNGTPPLESLLFRPWNLCRWVARSAYRSCSTRRSIGSTWCWRGPRGCWNPGSWEEHDGNTANIPNLTICVARCACVRVLMLNLCVNLNESLCGVMFVFH